MGEQLAPPPTVASLNTDVETNASREDSSTAKEVPPIAGTAAPTESVPAPSPPNATPASAPDAAPIQEPSPNKMQLSAVDIWSTRLASWAQVVTVIVVIFGYFYTVRPVFQFQLLQEQTAQLQIDNEAAKRKLAQTIAAQESAQARLGQLDAELASVAKNRDELVAQLNRESELESQAMKLEGQAMQRMESAQKQLSSEAAAHLLTQRRLLYTRFWQLFSWGVPLFLPVYMRDDDPDGTFFREAQDAWPNLYLQLSQSLDKLEKNNETNREFPPELLRPLRKTLDENKAALVCEPVNLESLRQDYLKEMATVDSDSRKDAVAELEKQRTDALTKKQRLIVTEDDVERFTRSNRIGRVYRIRSKYNDQVQALHRSCTSKAKPVIDLMSKQI